MFPYHGPIETLNFAIGIPLNALLLFLIRRYSRKELGAYKHLLTIFAAHDILLSVVEALIAPTAVRVGCIISVVGRTIWETRHIPCAYVAVYTLPFFLTNLNFLYRYWTIKSPQRLLLFSSKPFQAALIAAILSGSLTWYFVLYFISGGEVNEPATILLRNYYMEKFNLPINDGWIVLDYWLNGTLSLRAFFVLLLTDALMLVSFLAAITLSSLTFYHIHTSTIVSEHARKAQRTVLIALCVQTVVPILCVYVPYINNLNAPFFDVDDVISPETSASFISAFPLWDAAVIILLMRDYREGVRRFVWGGAGGKEGMAVNSKVFTFTVAPTALRHYSPKSV